MKISNFTTIKHGLVMKEKGLLAIIAAMLLMVLTNWQEKVDRTYASQSASSIIMSQSDQHNHEATLTDLTLLYNVCGSRPQRIITTQFSRIERSARSISLALRNIVKTLKSPNDSRRRLETAPFCTSVSSDYYVIALRHIIC